MIQILRELIEWYKFYGNSQNDTNFTTTKNVIVRKIRTTLKFKSGLNLSRIKDSTGESLKEFLLSVQRRVSDLKYIN